MSSINSRGKVYCLCDEYAEIERFLKSRSDLPQAYMWIEKAVRFSSYQWNYNRISKKYKMNFLRVAMDEFIRANDEGMLKREYWPDNNWETVQEMIEEPDRFVFKAYSRLKKDEMLASGFWEQIKKQADIYLYGAGKVAGEIVSLMCAHDAKITGLLVSSLEDNPTTVWGLSVMLADDEKVSRDAMVLIAAKETVQAGIAKSLERQGYKNIIPMDNELREALRLMYDE